MIVPKAVFVNFFLVYDCVSKLLNLKLVFYYS